MDPVIWSYIAVGAALAALLLALFYSRQVLAAPPGNERMQELSAAIREGAMAFLRREYQWVAVFVAAMSILIFFVLDYGKWASVAYIFGALLSALAGFIAIQY